MQINTEKFFALTATLAGFLPGAACVLSIDTSGTATEGQTTTTTSTTTETTDATSSGGTTGGTTGMSGTMGTSEAVPTTGTPTTGESTTSGTTGAPASDCCTEHATAGCSDPDIEACVCAEDSFCCGAAEGNWDSTCVGLVNALGCGMCEIDTDGPDTTGEGGETDSTTGAGSTSTG